MTKIVASCVQFVLKLLPCYRVGAGAAGAESKFLPGAGAA
jgi:hypothetical protein